MLGIFGFLAEGKVEGSVPALKGIIPHYGGEVMQVRPRKRLLSCARRSYALIQLFSLLASLAAAFRGTVLLLLLSVLRPR